MCEYISRAARSELVQLLVEELGSISGLAKEVGISHVAVLKWLRLENIHPSNTNLKRILELALELKPDEALKVLLRDLDKHATMMDKFGKGGK
ncbi:MAG: hypothetical protein AVW06_01350 [Hadesarchaea archaeon DG-33-1]|nr:MAG: hypothetical protein AVW06_01350 [Hadesarchaea archaeon DG-33-1]